MSKPFSLYLTTEVSSVAVSPESFCAAESHPNTTFAKWLTEWLSLPAFPFFPPQTLYLQICGPGGLEGGAAMSSLLHETLPRLQLSGRKTEGRRWGRGECPSAIARGFYDKLVKAGEIKTRVCRCKAGEKNSLGTERKSVLFCMAVGIPSASLCLSWRWWPQWEHCRFSHELCGLLQMC